MSRCIYVGYDPGDERGDMTAYPTQEQQEKPMEKPAVYYMSPESKYPDQIRLSFPDGKTIVYDRRIKQPSPKKYLNMPRHAKKG